MTLLTPESLAPRLGLTLPLDATTSARITEAIEDAEDRVVSFLNRTSLEAVQTTVQGLTADERWPLTDRRAWPQVDYQDRYRVVSYVVNATDLETFDVTFAVGLDVANDPELRPILSFIKADVAAQLSNDALFMQQHNIARVVTSVSAEGQSVSYAKGSTAADAAGAPPSLNTLKRWKRLSIAQANYPVAQPWPYN